MKAAAQLQADGQIETLSRTDAARILRNMRKSRAGRFIAYRHRHSYLYTLHIAGKVETWKINTRPNRHQ